MSLEKSTRGCVPVELVDLTFKNSEPLMLNINSGAKKSGAKKKEPVNSSSEDEGVADPVDEQLIAGSHKKIHTLPIISLVSYRTMLLLPLREKCLT